MILAGLGCFAILLIMLGGSSLLSSGDSSSMPIPTLIDNGDAGMRQVPPPAAEDEWRPSEEAVPPVPTWSNKHKQLLDRLGLGDVEPPNVNAAKPTEAPSRPQTLYEEKSVDDLTRMRRDRVKQVCTSLSRAHDGAHAMMMLLAGIHARMERL